MRLGLSCSARKAKRRTVIVSVPIIVLFFICAVIYKMQPAFFEYAKFYANNIANSVVDESVKEVFSDAEYRDFVKTEQSGTDSVKTLETDTAKVNELRADISRSIQQSIENRQSYVVRIPLGSVTGFYFLAGMGPKIPVRIYPVSIVNTEFKENFESVGINQSRHSLYLDISIQMSFAGFAYSQTETVNTSALLCETVIMGDTPRYYSGTGEQNR
jgi:sporulation protein YunB